ncbi:MAG: UrcA family protein [Steroidobacteraceae bacterium]
MNHISNTAARTSWMVAGAAAIAIFAGSAHAASEVAKVTVRYNEQTDTAELYAQLKRAAARVCRQYEGKALSKIADARACHAEVLDRAVANVGDSALSSLHRANADVRVVQRDAIRQRS